MAHHVGLMKANRRAFTLLELMVVIALMAILGAGLGIVLTRGGGVPLQAAETTLARIFQAARAQAALQQTEARVIIADTPDDGDRHLRFAGIVYRDADDPNLWRAANSGVRLPDGIRFRPTDSDAGGGSMQIEFPLAQATSEGGGPRWFYFAYDARGRMLTPGFVALAQGRMEAGELIFADTPGGGFMAAATGALIFDTE